MKQKVAYTLKYLYPAVAVAYTGDHVLAGQVELTVADGQCVLKSEPLFAQLKHRLPVMNLIDKH